MHCTGQRDGGKLDGGRERTVLRCNGDEIVATGESWAALPWRVREHYSGREPSGVAMEDESDATGESWFALQRGCNRRRLDGGREGLAMKENRLALQRERAERAALHCNAAENKRALQ